MQEPNKESGQSSENSILLEAICDKENINNNIKFIKELKKSILNLHFRHKNQLKILYERQRS